MHDLLFYLLYIIFIVPYLFINGPSLLLLVLRAERPIVRLEEIILLFVTCLVWVGAFVSIYFLVKFLCKKYAVTLFKPKIITLLSLGLLFFIWLVLLALDYSPRSPFDLQGGGSHIPIPGYPIPEIKASPTQDF